MGLRVILATVVVTTSLTSELVASAAPTSSPSTQPATDPAVGYRLGPGPHPTTNVDLELADKTTGQELPEKIRNSCSYRGLRSLATIAGIEPRKVVGFSTRR